MTAERGFARGHGHGCRRDRDVVGRAEHAVGAGALQRERRRRDGRRVELAVEAGRDRGRQREHRRARRRRQRRDADRPGRRRARLRAVGDPLPNDVDVGLRHGGQTGRHALADAGRAFELLDQIAVVRVARRDAQEVRALAARDADEQRIAVRGVEPQADRRVRAGMAVLAERLEDVRLDRVEVRRQRADRAAAAYESRRRSRTPRARTQAKGQTRRVAALHRVGSTHVAFSLMVSAAYECRTRVRKVHTRASARTARCARATHAALRRAIVSARAARRA